MEDSKVVKEWGNIFELGMGKSCLGIYSLIGSNADL
jgi:hypothetical protein